VAPAETAAVIRTALWRQIDEAEAQVSLSRGRVLRQLAIIGDLDARGRDASAARQLLEQHRLILQEQERKRDQLAEQLAAHK